MYYPHTEELLCTTSHKRNLNNTNPSSRRRAYTRFRHLTLRSIFLLYTRYHTDRTAHVCERCISHLLNVSMSWHGTSVLRQYVALQHTTHDCSDNSRRQTSRSKGYFELANMSTSFIMSPIPAGRNDQCPDSASVALRAASQLMCVRV